MEKLVTFRGSRPAIYGLVALEIIEGIRVVSPQPIETRALDVTVNIDLSIDLTVITAAIAAAWLARMIRFSGPNAKLYIDGKHVPVDEADITERLEAQDEGEQEH